MAFLQQNNDDDSNGEQGQNDPQNNLPNAHSAPPKIELGRFTQSAFSLEYNSTKGPHCKHLFIKVSFLTKHIYISHIFFTNFVLSNFKSVIFIDKLKFNYIF